MEKENQVFRSAGVRQLTPDTFPYTSILRNNEKADKLRDGTLPNFYICRFRPIIFSRNNDKAG